MVRRTHMHGCMGSLLCVASGSPPTYFVMQQRNELGFSRLLNITQVRTGQQY